jgi:hypothetical protein
VYSGERIEGKVMRQLRNALQPFMTAVKVSWGSLAVRDVAPQVHALRRLQVTLAEKECTTDVLLLHLQTVGPLYSGQKVTVYALLDKECPPNSGTLAATQVEVITPKQNVMN